MFFLSIFSVSALRRCNRAKRKRTKYNDEQLAVFEKAFKKSQNPSPGERLRLETKTGVSEHKIKIWFQNRRSKERRGTEKGGESKELMTTESNLEAEDEKQLNSICEETYEKDGEIEDQNTPSDIKSLIPEAVDSRESYQNQNGDTRKNQSNTSGNMEVSEEKTNIPSYMVLTLPCGTIAVESNDLYRRKMDKAQINKNIASDKKIHSTSLLTNTSTEVKVPYARGAPAVNVNGIYRSEFKDTGSSEDNADQDVNLIHTQVQSDAAVDESRENNTDQVVEVRHTEVQNNVAQYGAQERSSENGKAQGLEQLHTDVENNITQYEVQKRSSENGTTQKIKALPTEVQNNVTQSASQDRSSKNGTAQGVEVLHSEVERNASPDTGGAVADEVEGLYCSETLNTSSLLPPLQPTKSCFDEMRRNRVRVGADKVPDAMTTLLSSNDVINSIEKNIDNAEKRDDHVSQKVDTKEDMMDDKETEEDMQMQ